jgi:diguanylate cyclase (GGDEF)-like protein
MLPVKLKKLIANPELLAIFHDLTNSLDTPIGIFDLEGKNLAGRVDENPQEKYPIQIKNHIIGWVVGNAHTALIASILSLFARQEDEKKSLAKEMLDKYEEINFLYDLAENLANCHGVEEIAVFATNMAQKLIDATHASVMLLNQDNQLEIVATTGSLPSIKLECENGIAGYVMTTGKAEIVNDVLADSRYIEGENGIRSLICAPLKTQQGCIGVMNIGHSNLMNYTAENLKLFSALTSHVSEAIRNATLYDQLWEYSHNLEVIVSARTAELQKANLELRNLVSLDGLTQLANRRKFDEYLGLEWRRMAREKGPLSLILCDVDYFKYYNDTYGHQGGDDCLRQIAAILRNSVTNPADLVARYGGEEFAIILPNTDTNRAVNVAEIVQEFLRELKIIHVASSVNRYVTMSFGIATITPGLDLTPENLVATADVALYEAKRQGRNRIVCHNNLVCSNFAEARKELVINNRIVITKLEAN